MTEWVQPEHREVHDLLTNWGRWALSRSSPGHCASIEHRYNSPQCWNDRNPRPEEPNQPAALMIEQQMRIIPKLSRKLLKLKYVLRADKQFTSRRLRFHVDRYDQLLYTARQIVLNLTRHQLAPNVHGRFSNLKLSDSVETRSVTGAAPT